MSLLTLGVKCPKCGVGESILKPIGISCSENNSKDSACDFVLWRKQFGKELNDVQLKKLFLNKKTDTLSFKNKEKKTYSAQVILNDQYETTISFVKRKKFARD